MDREVSILPTYTMDQLADMYNVIEKQKDLIQGLILLAGRVRADAEFSKRGFDNPNHCFGDWVSNNLFDTHQVHANRLMNEARFFRDKPLAVEKLQPSVRYAISAPVNDHIAADVLEKCMNHEGRVTVKLVNAFISGDPEPEPEPKSKKDSKEVKALKAELKELKDSREADIKTAARQMVDHLDEQLIQLKVRQWSVGEEENAAAALTGIFTVKEVKLIRGCLHPDSNASEERRKEAFCIFNRVYG